MQDKKNETVRVIVKSKRVPVAINYVQEIRWTMVGTFSTRRPALQFENRLEDGDLATLEYVAQVAAFANLSLEVVDLSKRNFLSRLVARLIRTNPHTPSIVFPGAAIQGFRSRGSVAKPDGLNALAISRPDQKG